MSPQKPHPVRPVHKRHRWMAIQDFDGTRGQTCVRCPMSRRWATAPPAVLYYHPDRSPSVYPMRHRVPPCSGPSTQKDTEP
jgi:hypothetical protein